MPFLLSDSAGLVNAGEPHQVDLTQAVPRTRTLDAQTEARDRRWFTLYPSARVAIFLAPMHGWEVDYRLWQVSATVAKSGDTLRDVAAAIGVPAEVLPTPTMTLLQRWRVARNLGDTYLAGHNGFLAWRAMVEALDLQSLTAVQRAHLATQAAAWGHAAWANRRDQAWDLDGVVGAESH